MINVELTNNIVNQSKLKNIIVNIFSGKTPDILRIIGNNLHPTISKSNYDFHKELIYKLVDDVKAYSGFKTDKTLTRINISKRNKINIDIHISKNNNQIQFYFHGDSLQKYYMFLPKFVNEKKIIGPRTGADNSKWYDFEFKTYIIKMAVNLRLLEIYLFDKKIVDSWDDRFTGLLGSEVSFEIPESYKNILDINSPEQICSTFNPTKINMGLYIYGKNGTSETNIQSMINFIREKFGTKYNEILYPDFIKGYELKDFAESKYMIGFSSWNHHSRLLIKLNIENNKQIHIIDPWMKRLPEIIIQNLSQSNSNIIIELIPRIIKDQSREGSCSLCAFSRLFNFVDNYNWEQIDRNLLINLVNIPLTDSDAYLTSYVYRKSIGH